MKKEDMQQMRRTSTAAVGSLLLTLILALAGCGTAAAPTTSSPTATAATETGTATSTSQGTVCQGLGTIDEALTSLSQVGSNTTIGEVKTTQQKITTQLDAIATRIPGENGPVLARLEVANSQLTAALQGLPDSATIAQTSTGVQGFQTRVANAQAAQTQLATRLRCSP